ncbi:argininosuccinate lyase [Metabacillus herbersteinensis]|uniref:Argininosuccinate lyase n=1 Tax=Metabacillus herbersteinensis TaxID=283816 RepID=A0ABV6GMB4_9BACI
MRERLKVDLSEEVINYLILPALEAEQKRSFTNIMDINKGHLLMLISKGIVTREDGQKIMDALEEISLKGASNLELDPKLEELYFNIEAALIKIVGVEVGGQLHTGRSRNDLYATLARMNSRDSLLIISEQLVRLREEILKIAENSLYAVMSGYTHMQPAEPVTLSHYLSAILSALERDNKRLEQSFNQINISPLGAGAMASTSFQIDRQETSHLLGFNNAMDNSIDSIASRDYVLEALSFMNILMNNLSRFSHDLYIWSTDEFGIVEVGDSVAACSSIMPQKKNPITLEHIKAKSGHVIGALVSATSCLKNTSYGHSRDATESFKYLWDAFSEVEASLHLMTATVKTLKFKEEKMFLRTLENFSTVTELANTIVREANISFREAHQIVGYLVREMIDKKIPVSKINSEIVKDISKLVIGRQIILTKEGIQKALDPIQNVELKNTSGGPAPREVKKQLKKLNESLKLDKEWLNEQQGIINHKKQQLSKVQA